MADKRVLIVDDEEDIVVPTTSFLKKKLENVEILAAYDGEEALNIIRSKPIDVVVTDIRMPKLDGLELLLRAKQSNPDTRFIVMTAYGSPAVREKATRLGAIHYIEKPFELQDLYEKVDQLLNFEGGFVGSVAQLELSDIIQMVCLGKKSLTVEVKSKNRVGHIYVIDGDIVNARTGKVEGEEAFYEILSWEKGEFRFLPPEEKIEKRIEIRWENLLMEAMRVIDERRKQAGDSKEEIDNVDTENFRRVIAALREKVDGIVSNGIIDISNGKLIVRDEMAIEDQLEEKVERYSELLVFVENLMGEIEGKDLKEVFLVFENEAVVFYRVGGKFVWGIKLSNVENLGRLKIVTEKLIRELESIS